MVSRLSLPNRRTYDPEQLSAGWQSMSMLAALLQRGGQPAAVKPTMALRPDEKEYASFLVDVEEYHSTEVDLSSGVVGLLFAGAGPEADAEGCWVPRGRQGVVVTTRRIVLGADFDFRDLITIQPNPLDFELTLFFQGAVPIRLRGPWVPWMTVVLCWEMFGTPWPPGPSPVPQLQVPAQRGASIKTI